MHHLRAVLILVLVEHALGDHIGLPEGEEYVGLNPCFSGTCSRRILQDVTRFRSEVLILVLVEHALGVTNSVLAFTQSFCLNPCFSGTCSRRATFTTYTISKYYACKFGIFICF